MSHPTAADRAERTAPQRRTPFRARWAAVVGLPAAGLLAVTTVVPIAAASADPSASAWARLRNCESSGNYSIDTGNGYYGAYQFDLPTWQSVGGTGYPNDAAPGVQDALALKLYRLRGWQPWTCATILGLAADSDAGSGVTGNITVPGSSPAPAPTSGTPSWPGVYWSSGDRAPALATWQQHMRSRGAALPASGVFDAQTLSVVDAIQQQNGLPQTGLLGPVTWKLAWTGGYRAAPPAAAAPSSPAAPSAPTRSAPAMPGPSWFSIWDTSPTIRTFQLQMASRGADLAGATGVFGPITLAAVNRLQRENGLPQTGILGPNTWKLAWTGRY